MTVDVARVAVMQLLDRAGQILAALRVAPGEPLATGGWRYKLDGGRALREGRAERVRLIDAEGATVVEASVEPMILIEGQQL